MVLEKTITGKYRQIIWVKVLVLLVCCSLIYQKISDREGFGKDFINIVTETIDTLAIFVLTGVILLMPLNWLLETLKWRLLVRPHSEISLAESFQGVVSGLSLGFITPCSIGDYAGRLLSLKGRNPSQLIGSVWLNRAMQMLVTGLFGIVGSWMFIHKSPAKTYSISLWWCLVLLVLMIAVIFFHRSKIKIFGENLWYYLSMTGEYSRQDYLLLFFYSLGRYTVFSIQYLLILNIFEIPLPIFTLFGGVSWMFLIKSIVPSFNFLSDLGVRELSVLAFFDLYYVSRPAVLTGSLLLWVINILTPVLIGLYFVFRLKIISKQ